MSGGVNLCPCPLCGGNRGYALHDGGDHKRWNVVCIVCGEIVSECRRDGLAEAANTAWNEAGAYAAGLLADRDRLAAENAELRKRVRDVTAAAVTMLFDSHREDVLREFSESELFDVLAASKHMQQMTVEGIYRAAWLAARPNPSAQPESPSWPDTKHALDSWLKSKGIFDDCGKATFATAAWKACWDFIRSARPNPENTDGR